eukprot:gene18367-830_t
MVEVGKTCKPRDSEYSGNGDKIRKVVAEDNIPGSTQGFLPSISMTTQPKDHISAADPYSLLSWSTSGAIVSGVPT